MSSRYKKQNWITGLFFLLNIGLIFELSMSQKDSVENIKRLLESDGKLQLTHFDIHSDEKLTQGA